jgi:epoxide hydrolase-like protein
LLEDLDFARRPFSLKNSTLLCKPCCQITHGFNSPTHKPKTSNTSQKEDTMTQTSATQPSGEQAADKNAIRPFHVNISEAELTELRRRINATKWPERETVTDASQGMQLATTQKLASYWATDYDWAQVRGETERAPAIHYRDRWGRHSFHPRPFET